MLNVSGYTEDGKLVISNVFQFYETHGLPLDYIADEFQPNSWVIDWFDFISQALRGGMNSNKINTMINQITEYKCKDKIKLLIDVITYQKVIP